MHVPHGLKVNPRPAVGCDYPLFNCDSLGSTVWQDLRSNLPEDETSIQFGLQWSRELQLNLRNEVVVDGNTYDVVSITVTDVAGLPEGLELGGELSYNANEYPSGNVLPRLDRCSIGDWSVRVGSHGYG